MKLASKAEDCRQSEFKASLSSQERSTLEMRVERSDLNDLWLFLSSCFALLVSDPDLPLPISQILACIACGLPQSIVSCKSKEMLDSSLASDRQHSPR